MHLERSRRLTLSFLIALAGLCFAPHASPAETETHLFYHWSSEESFYKILGLAGVPGDSISRDGLPERSSTVGTYTAAVHDQYLAWEKIQSNAEGAGFYMAGSPTSSVGYGPFLTIAEIEVDKGFQWRAPGTRALITQYHPPPADWNVLRRPPTPEEAKHVRIRLRPAELRDVRNSFLQIQSRGAETYLAEVNKLAATVTAIPRIYTPPVGVNSELPKSVPARIFLDRLFFDELLPDLMSSDRLKLLGLSKLHPIEPSAYSALMNVGGAVYTLLPANDPRRVQFTKELLPYLPKDESTLLKVLVGSRSKYYGFLSGGALKNLDALLGDGTHSRLLRALATSNDANALHRLILATPEKSEEALSVLRSPEAATVRVPLLVEFLDGGRARDPNAPRALVHLVDEISNLILSNLKDAGELKEFLYLFPQNLRPNMISELLNSNPRPPHWLGWIPYELLPEVARDLEALPQAKRAEFLAEPRYREFFRKWILNIDQLHRSPFDQSGSEFSRAVGSLSLELYPTPEEREKVWQAYFARIGDPGDDFHIQTAITAILDPKGNTRLEGALKRVRFKAPDSDKAAWSFWSEFESRFDSLDSSLAYQKFEAVFRELPHETRASLLRGLGLHIDRSADESIFYKKHLFKDQSPFVPSVWGDRLWASQSSEDQELIRVASAAQARLRFGPTAPLLTGEISARRLSLLSGLSLPSEYAAIWKAPVLVDALFISEDANRGFAKPQLRFNESMQTIDGVSYTQPAFQNFEGAWRELASLSSVIDLDRTATSAEVGAAQTKILTESLIDSNHALISSGIEGAKPGLNNGRFRTPKSWQRSKYVTLLPRSEVSLIEGTEAEKELRNFFSIEKTPEGPWKLRFLEAEAVLKNLGDPRVLAKPEIKDLVQLISDRIRKISDPIDRAVEILRLVPRVHPFENGNGRTARLWAAQTLISAGLPAPIGLPTTDFAMTPAELKLHVRKALRLGKFWEDQIRQAGKDGISAQDFIQGSFRGSPLEGLIHFEPRTIAELEAHVQWLESQSEAPYWAGEYARELGRSIDSMRREGRAIAQLTEFERRDLIRDWSSRFQESWLKRNPGASTQSTAPLWRVASPAACAIRALGAAGP